MSKPHPADEAFEAWPEPLDCLPIEAFRAGYGAAKAWIPVAKAPRDGTRIWGYGPGVGCLIVHWDGREWRNGEGYICDITHFQFLPGPPR